MSSARPAALETASSRAGSSPRAASWTSAATFCAAALEDRDGSSCGRNDVDLLPVDIHVLLGGRHPVAELERGVSQGAGERVSKLTLLRTIAQLDHELAEPDPREARLEQTERDRRSARWRGPPRSADWRLVVMPADAWSAISMAARSAVVTPPVTRIGASARRSSGEADCQRRTRTVATPAAIAMPPSRCAFMSALCTLMSSRTKRRFLGQGQPPTCSMPMNMSITIWSAIALTYAADDEKALQPRVEPTVGKGEDEMRQRGRRNRAQGEADRERQRAVRRRRACRRRARTRCRS